MKRSRPQKKRLLGETWTGLCVKKNPLHASPNLTYGSSLCRYHRGRSLTVMYDRAGWLSVTPLEDGTGRSVFIPGRAACLECITRRVKALSPPSAWCYRQFTGEPSQPTIASRGQAPHAVMSKQ